MVPSPNQSQKAYTLSRVESNYHSAQGNYLSWTADKGYIEFTVSYAGIYAVFWSELFPNLVYIYMYVLN